MKKKNKRAMVAYYSDILFNTFRNIDMAHFIPLDNKLQKLVVGIDPIQDLHGYDNPWPAGGGVNKFNVEDIQPFNSNVIVTKTNDSFTVTNNNIYYVNPFRGSTADMTWNLQPGEYTISMETAVSFNLPVYASTDGTSYSWYNNGINAGQLSRTFTVSAEKPYITIRGQLEANGSVTISKFQLQSGSTVTAWAPYSNICPISGRSSVNVIVSTSTNPLDGTITNIALGTTVYGGTLDVVTGVLTVDRAMADLGSFNYNPYTYAGVFGGIAIVTPFPKSFQAGEVANAKCSALKVVSDNAFNLDGLKAEVAVNVNGYVKVKGVNATTAEELKAELSGVMLCYELATPQTIQLTPQQINTIVGSWNYVWCDSGKIIEIEA